MRTLEIVLGLMWFGFSLFQLSMLCGYVPILGWTIDYPGTVRKGLWLSLVISLLTSAVLLS